MALTVQQLAVALRLTQDAAGYAKLPAGQQEVLTRNLGAAQAEIAAYLGGDNAVSAVPKAVVDEAAVRIAAFLYDATPADGRAQHPLRQSGAQSLLAPFRVLRLATPEAR